MNLNTFTLLFTASLMLFSCGGGGGSNPPKNNSSSAASSSTSIPAVLPKIELNSGNNVIVDEPKVTVTMKVTEYDASGIATVSYNGLAGAEFHGSSSAYFNQIFDIVDGQLIPTTGDIKKSFGVETRDSTGAGIDVAVLGLPVEEDWILLAPFGDKTLIRDTFLYSLSREMGAYASRWKYFELYVNNDYRGIYILLEKIKRDSLRLDISHLKVTDNTGTELTGGYILKIDKTTGEDPLDPTKEDGYQDSFSFISEQVDDSFNSKHHFIYKEPKSTEITGPQKEYIQNYMHQFEAALAGANFKDETSGYRNYIDVDSFIDYFILNELSRNVDGFNLSLYMFKDKNKKLALGPIWDFNLAFGNATWCGAERTDGWAHNHAGECPGLTPFPVPFWWDQLLSDPYFTGRLKARWASLRLTTLSDSALTTKIDTMVAQLKNTSAVTSNFQKWPILDRWVWPNPFNPFIPRTYDGEIAQLKVWLSARTAWLDQQYLAL